MLRAVAYHHPVDFGTLKRVLADWRSGELDYETFKNARNNLIELDMIWTRPHQEHLYLTPEGWRRLGGETEFKVEYPL